MPITLANHLRRRREKIFGPALPFPLDRNAKARAWVAAAAYNHAHKTPRQHWGPLTRVTLSVFRVLLWRFHDADGTGRCFPSYEAIAKAAKCHRDSVAVAITALERAGLLTWVHRITRDRTRARDLLGDWALSWQTIRTSNIVLPTRYHRICKSENPSRPQNLDFNKRSGARLNAAQAMQGSAQRADKSVPSCVAQLGRRRSGCKCPVASTSTRIVEAERASSRRAGNRTPVGVISALCICTCGVLHA